MNAQSLIDKLKPAQEEWKRIHDLELRRGQVFNKLLELNLSTELSQHDWDSLYNMMKSPDIENLTMAEEILTVYEGKKD